MSSLNVTTQSLEGLISMDWTDEEAGLQYDRSVPQLTQRIPWRFRKGTGIEATGDGQIY